MWVILVFFSGLDIKTRSQLKISRAEMLIAENKLRAAQAEDKMKSYEAGSLGAFTMEFRRYLREMEEVKKKTAGGPMESWAETIVTAMGASVAGSAPSSVPSFEEVGMRSALRSTGGSVCAGRREEYERKWQDINYEYDESYTEYPGERRAKLVDLKIEYRDVCGYAASPRSVERLTVEKLLAENELDLVVREKLLNLLENKYAGDDDLDNDDGKQSLCMYD